MEMQATKPLEIVHLVFGSPMKNTSMGGAKYLDTLLDNLLKNVRVYMKNQKQMSKICKEL
jgi:hypothetical protein